VVDHDANMGPKLLTSEWAKHSRAMDPKARVSANQLGGQGRYEQGEGSKKPHRRVTFQMLINKYRRRQEKEEHRQQEHARREEDHWRCPFFMHCWNAGMHVPLADDFPECNRNKGK